MSEFGKYTEAYILEQMKAQVTSGIDTSEGSITQELFTPMAVELAEGYIGLDEVINLFYPQTTNGQYLDNWVELVGKTRKPGTFSVGKVTLTGTAGAAVPAGTKVQTQGSLVYETTAAVTISNTTVDVAVQAEAIGSTYNVPAGAITSLPIAIPGVISVTNAAAMTGGTDRETDSALLERFLAEVKRPSTSGNKSDYYNWAMSVSGIGDAKILPLWNGNGAVKIVLVDSNMQPANNTLVSNVQTYTESVRPIGATVTYVAAVALNINVSASLILATGYTISNVLADVQTNITEYLKIIAFSDNLSSSTHQDYVSYAKIGEAILSVKGVLDYSNLTLNSGTSNIEVPVADVAVLGTVTLS